MSISPEHAVGLEVSVATDVGRVRSINQDVALVGRVRVGGAWSVVGLVADGMGGGIRGEEASRVAAETCLEELGNAIATAPLEALVRSVGAAHEAVLRGAAGLGLSRGTFGTTFVGALVEERSGQTVIVNVGDSRAYVISAAGVVPVTRDHSIVAERLVAGRISPQEARDAADRAVLTRALGTPGRLRVDVFGPRLLRPGEVLLLCSDGLHGMLEDTEIGRVAASGSPLELASDLVAAANHKGGEDNISVVVIAGPRFPPRIGPRIADLLLGRLRSDPETEGWRMATLEPGRQIQRERR